MRSAFYRENMAKCRHGHWVYHWFQVHFACTFQRVHRAGFRLEMGFSNLFPDLLIDLKVCDDIKSEHLIAYIFSATWSQYRWHGLSQSFKNERMYIFYALLHNLIVDTILTSLLKCHFLKFKKNYVVQSEPFRHSWVQFKAATAARNSIDPGWPGGWCFDHFFCVPKIRFRYFPLLFAVYIILNLRW